MQGVTEILPVFSTVLSELDTWQTLCPLKVIMQLCKFGKNWCSGNHALFTGINIVLSVLLTFID
jgi:hypothetical protein